MTAQSYTTKSGATQFKPVLSEDEYRATHDDNVGFCLACGQETVGGVEPDARQYTCESCGQPKVYGLEELLIMGLLILKDPDAVPSER
jgi:hypothetical protein